MGARSAGLDRRQLDAPSYAEANGELGSNARMPRNSSPIAKTCRVPSGAFFQLSDTAYLMKSKFPCQHLGGSCQPQCDEDSAIRRSLAPLLITANIPSLSHEVHRLLPTLNLQEFPFRV